MVKNVGSDSMLEVCANEQTIVEADVTVADDKNNTSEETS